MFNRDVLVFKTGQALSNSALQLFSKLARESIKQRGKFSVALSGGGTPQGLYKLLGSSPHKEKLPWEKMHFFWGDERCVPPDQEGSNFFQAKKSFLGHVSVPPDNIFRVKGELEPFQAAEDYSRQLCEFASKVGGYWPRFDLVLLGMGTDGHTASLFPGEIPDLELTTAALAVTASYGGRPAHRVTLTPPVFNAARHILFLVTGQDKSTTLSDVLDGSYNPEKFPAQRIRPTHGTVTWLVDKVAASQLR